jgi:prenyltransferase beta subunit
MSPSNWNWRDWLRGIWLVVALLLCGRLIAHVWTVARMVRRSTPAPENFKLSLSLLASESGITRRVDVRESVEITSPLLTGLLRPVIVLPRTLARNSDADAIRMMLGHELAHVAGRDLWWTLCLRCASIALWFHPLMWRVGRAHRLACETVSDGIAAGQTDRQQYVRLLARLALGARRRPVWEGGVAMLATSEITQRLRRLDRPLAVGRLSFRLRLLSVLTLALLTGGVAAAQIVRADAVPLAAGDSPAQTRMPDDANTDPNAPGPPLPVDVEALKKSRDAAEATLKALDRQVKELEAVQKGLAFLTSNQRENGAFAMNRGEDPRVGLTAICALAMYRAAGISEADLLDRVDRAVDYTLSTQTQEGYFDGPKAMMYDQGFATWLLAELHDSERWRVKVRQPLERAVVLIQKVQHTDGGWGYQPKPDDTWGDLTQAACQLRALVAARACGIEVPDETIRQGIAYLSTCQSASGAFAYTPRGVGTFSCTAASLSALRSVGVDNSEVLDRGTAALVEYMDQTRKREPYWWFYGCFFASEVVRSADDQRQRAWLASVQDQLIECQGIRDGSWNDSADSPVCSTAFALLILTTGDQPAPGAQPAGASNVEERSEVKPGGAAAASPAAPPMPTVPMLTATVHVTDQQGRPVAGAVVKPFGLRCRREPASHYSWNDKTFGPAPSVTTDADGIARVPCPKFVFEEVETGTVTWLVDHPDHVVFWADRPFSDQPAEIPLEDGIVIAVRAIDDTTDQLVKAPFAMLSGPSFGNEWTLKDDGTLVSRTVARERRILRVVHVPDDAHEPVLFSDVIDLQQQPGDVLDLTLRLKPGVRVTGNVDDVMPRPVSGGTVTAMVITGPQDSGQESTYDARWSWNEVAAIDEQGRFDLGWFPQGELLQLIAVSDGFVSAPPDQQQLALSATRLRPPFVVRAQDRRTQPQVALLDGPAIDVAVPMTPTTSCRIRMVGPDGAPVSGATVAFWPNQIWLSGGSQVLGDGFSQSGWLRASRREDAGSGDLARNQYRHDASPRYQATSGDDGIAVVANLPLENQASFHVTHAALELPPAQFLRRYASVDLVAGEVAEITVTLQPKGTQVLGRED